MSRICPRSRRGAEREILGLTLSQRKPLKSLALTLKRLEKCPRDGTYSEVFLKYQIVQLDWELAATVKERGCLDIEGNRICTGVALYILQGESEVLHQML